MARAKAKVEQGEETAKALIRLARAMFTEHGFNGVPAESIVEAAGITRGALYHHFKGKSGLFEAVFVECEREIACRIEEAARLQETPVKQLIAGSLAFLEACADPEIRRIVIEDAPSVLGWSRWREIDAQHGLALLRGAIERLNQDGNLKAYNVDALVYLLSGAMNELAMWVAESDNPSKNLKSAKKTVTALIRDMANVT